MLCFHSLRRKIFEGGRGDIMIKSYRGGHWLSLAEGSMIAFSSGLEDLR
jgi:hypothetical protein